jgi:hypothetical protein
MRLAYLGIVIVALAACDGGASTSTLDGAAGATAGTSGTAGDSSFGGGAGADPNMPRQCQPTPIPNNDDQCKSLGFPSRWDATSCPIGLKCQALAPTGFDQCVQPPILANYVCCDGRGFKYYGSSPDCPDAGAAD